MDAIRDIENHPAFAIVVENEDILRKRLYVLECLREIKCIVFKFKFTERPNPGSGKFEHYKECKFGSQVDTCPCSLIGGTRYRALKNLDEIQSMNRG